MLTKFDASLHFPESNRKIRFFSSTASRSVRQQRLAAGYIPPRLRDCMYFRDAESMPTFHIARSYAKPARADGFSMLEVLISIIVLTVGLLGGAALQASAMAANRDARIASSAVLYAREIGEMMRGNKAIALKTSPADNPYLIDPLTYSRR